jgi:hypothetical protein
MEVEGNDIVADGSAMLKAYRKMERERVTREYG